MNCIYKKSFYNFSCRGGSAMATVSWCEKWWMGLWFRWRSKLCKFVLTFYNTINITFWHQYVISMFKNLLSPSPFLITLTMPLNWILNSIGSVVEEVKHSVNVRMCVIMVIIQKLNKMSNCVGAVVDFLLVWIVIRKYNTRCREYFIEN